MTTPGPRCARLRIIGNLLTILSLILCVATAALWVRSYRVRDIIGFGREGGNCHLAQSILGRLHVLSDIDGGCLGGVTYRADRLSPRATWHGGMSSYPATRDVQWRLGFVWQTYNSFHMGLGQPYSTNERLIVVPYWFPTGVFALAPLAWMTAMRRRLRLLHLMILVAAIAISLAFLIFLERMLNPAVAPPR